MNKNGIIYENQSYLGLKGKKKRKVSPEGLTKMKSRSRLLPRLSS